VRRVVRGRSLGGVTPRPSSNVREGLNSGSVRLGVGGIISRLNLRHVSPAQPFPGVPGYYSGSPASACRRRRVALDPYLEDEGNHRARPARSFRRSSAPRSPNTWADCGHRPSAEVRAGSACSGALEPRSHRVGRATPSFRTTRQGAARAADVEFAMRCPRSPGRLAVSSHFNSNRTQFSFLPATVIRGRGRRGDYRINVAVWGFHGRVRH